MKYGEISVSSSPATALLLVDFVSDFNFEDGNRIFRRSRKAVMNAACLKRRLKNIGVPVIYVNDELGKGRIKFRETLGELENRSAEAAEIMSVIRPEEDDHWVVKPQRSGFYGTPLGSLLLKLGVNSVIIAGVTTDMCVLFTAHDAYMRGYSVRVPSDCCAALEDSHHDEALRFLERVADVDSSPSTKYIWNLDGASGSPIPKIDIHTHETAEEEHRVSYDENSIRRKSAVDNKSGRGNGLPYKEPLRHAAS